MALTIIKILLLLCVIIIPLRGPRVKRKPNYRETPRIEAFSNYGINEDGELECVNKDKVG